MSEATKVELPRYRCHKEVWALKIARVAAAAGDRPAGADETDGGLILTPEEAGYGPFRVDANYRRNHSPMAGGYYVRYKDGYESFSPAKAFEEGYTRI